MESSKSEEIDPVDFGLSLALPLAASTLTACGYTLLHRTVLATTPWGPRGLVYGPYFLLIPLGAFASYYGFSKGKTGGLAAVVGFVVALLATLNFRGSLYWSGSFDMVEWSKIHTLLPFGLALVVGALAANVNGGLKFDPQRTRTLAILAVFASLAWSWLDANIDIGLYSLTPYTHHYAVTGVFVVSLLLALAFRWNSK